jgi:hypothetical protein
VVLFEGIVLYRRVRWFFAHFLLSSIEKESLKSNAVNDLLEDGLSSTNAGDTVTRRKQTQKPALTLSGVLSG